MRASGGDHDDDNTKIVYVGIAVAIKFQKKKSEQKLIRLDMAWRANRILFLAHLIFFFLVLHIHVMLIQNLSVYYKFPSPNIILCQSE